MHLSVAEKVYHNRGNADVVALVDRSARKVLDVGCGAGDNAVLLRQRDPDTLIYGITGSPSERRLARPHPARVPPCQRLSQAPGTHARRDREARRPTMSPV